MKSMNASAKTYNAMPWNAARAAALGFALWMASPSIAQTDATIEPRRMRPQPDPMAGVQSASVVPATASSLRGADAAGLGSKPDARAANPHIELKGPSQKELSTAKSPTHRSSMINTLLALGGVVGLFLAVHVLLKRIQPKASQRLPNDLVEVLGTTSLGPKQQLLLLRFGNKLLLVSRQPGETVCLSELSEPREVSELLSRLNQVPATPRAKAMADVVVDALMPKRSQRGSAPST